MNRTGFVPVVLVAALSLSVGAGMYDGAHAARGQDPPNGYNLVVAVNAAYPGLIASNSTEFTDRVCQALAQLDPRWGRKARARGDAASRNADALAYKFGSDDADKALVDIVYSSDSPQAAPAWQVTPAPATGNGFWIPCPGAPAPTPTPTPTPAPTPAPACSDVLEQLAALRREIVQLRASVDELVARPVPACSAIAWPDYVTTVGPVRLGWIGTTPAVAVVLHPKAPGQ